MSDIPVGSPPVPPGRHAAPGGWYPDPLDPAHERYWDGWQWSRNTRPREGAAPPAWPAGPPAPSAPGAPTGSAYPPAGGYPPGGYGAYPGAAPYPAARPALLTADGVAVSSWWWRALAALLDSLFTGVLVTLLSLPLFRGVVTAFSAYYTQVVDAARAGGQQPPVPDFSALFSTSDQLLAALIGLVIGLAYQVVFLRRRGATPGKIICGLRVVPVDQGRAPGPLGWQAIVVRSVIWVVPGLYSVLFLVTVADVLVPLWQPRRQALHDLAARTQVVRPRG